jgi:hypothetical protein
MATQLEHPQQNKIQLSAIQEMGFHSGPAFALLRTTAEFLSKCDIIPKQFIGHIPNCAVALNMAQRMGADPLMLMQNMDVIYNRPSFRAKFLIATFNVSGDFSKLHYEWNDRDKPMTDEWGCRAFATEKESGEILHGPWVKWKMVKAEGWDKKNGSKWMTIPELMFMYRAGAWFINTHCPELSMGLRTAEEEEDIQTAKDITSQVEVIERKTNMPPPYPGPITEGSGDSPKPDALVDADKSKQAPTNGEHKQPEKPQATSTSAPKASQGPKKNQPAAATQEAGNASYAETEEDPFKSGELPL